MQLVTTHGAVLYILQYVPLFSFVDDKVVYTGNELTYTCRGLKERTDYEFRLRAFTDDEEESFISDGSVIQTFRASMTMTYW